MLRLPPLSGFPDFLSFPQTQINHQLTGAESHTMCAAASQSGFFCLSFALMRFLSLRHLLAKSNLSKVIRHHGYWNSSMTIQFRREHLRGLTPRHCPQGECSMEQGGLFCVFTEPIEETKLPSPAPSQVNPKALYES